ncbi:hypothetical protein NDU88_004442 [Pleurodeles waltl]|uniref:Uncharacterized protein n=1 Tax=Pleurodeles waltl TaxID=8319 RepID=A0AAV7N303_PLEWA|nr:hypothetical protein NDU88_004442 [Pleurodeles waltl]
MTESGDRWRDRRTPHVSHRREGPAAPGPGEPGRCLGRGADTEAHNEAQMELPPAADSAATEPQAPACISGRSQIGQGHRSGDLSYRGCIRVATGIARARFQYHSMSPLAGPAL